MDARTWFEESLRLTEQQPPIVKSGIPEVPADYFAEAYKRNRIKVVVDIPRFLALPVEPQQLRTVPGSTFVLIRLGFQLLPEGDALSVPLNFARCSARLARTDDHHAQPRIHDLYPRELFEGHPTKVHLSLSPKLEVGPVRVEAVTASTEITMGHVEPVITGWAGLEERHPYWHLHPKRHDTASVLPFWLTVELPPPARSLDIAVLAEADVLDKAGPLRMRPKKYLWDERPAYRIELP
jgi:hypothetical protein